MAVMKFCSASSLNTVRENASVKFSNMHFYLECNSISGVVSLFLKQKLQKFGLNLTYLYIYLDVLFHFNII